MLLLTPYTHSRVTLCIKVSMKKQQDRTIRKKKEEKNSPLVTGSEFDYCCSGSIGDF